MMLMSEITFEGYKNAIKAHYEAMKIEGVYGSGDISNITPAQLRDLCRRISEMGLTKTDENTFRFFFNAKEDEKLGRAIDNFGTGKLKSVISFLNGKKSDNPTRTELAAIIVDFQPRPFLKFSKSDWKKDYAMNEELTLNEKKAEIHSLITINPFFENSFLERKSKKIIFAIIFIALSFAFIGYFVFQQKQCMQWSEDHYEMVDCSLYTEDPVKFKSIKPLDKNLMDLKKIQVCDTTTFFKNGEAIIWYAKTEKGIDFFNTHGRHPENENALKPVTHYIIDKYIRIQGRNGITN